jgi:hypothetical protein
MLEVAGAVPVGGPASPPGNHSTAAGVFSPIFAQREFFEPSGDDPGRLSAMVLPLGKTTLAPAQWAAACTALAQRVPQRGQAFGWGGRPPRNALREAAIRRASSGFSFRAIRVFSFGNGTVPLPKLPRQLPHRDDPPLFSIDYCGENLIAEKAWLGHGGPPVPCKAVQTQAGRGCERVPVPETQAGRGHERVHAPPVCFRACSL